MALNATANFPHKQIAELEILNYCRAIKSCGECQLSNFCSPCRISEKTDFLCTSKLDSITSCQQNNMSNICVSTLPWWIYICFISLSLVIIGMVSIVLYKCCTCLFVKVKETEIEEINLFSPRKIELNSLGKWAIITGASDGIGKALAEELVKERLNLLLIGRNEEKLREVVKELNRMGVLQNKQEIKYYIMDFRDKSCYFRFREYLNSLEDIGLLINNVGVSYPFAQFFEETSIELIDELIEVNVRSVILMTRLVYEVMKKSGSSQLKSDPLYSAYAATKCVSESLCRSLQAECQSGNIIIQCHTPMLVTTKMSKVKRETIFVISPKRFAVESLKKLKSGYSAYTTIVPYFWHKLELLAANIIPFPIWNKIRLSQTKRIRERALKKKET
ncbi:putative 3-ketoacyl-CoA reductase [Cryptosporidium felis]|nr:putative 3-ketoacyl-CoA reductase [Cryptosporidium felis]